MRAHEPAPEIASFVIRFVRDPDAAGYWGWVRHVQSDTEIRFTHWQEAQAFIARFAPAALGIEASTSSGGQDALER